MDEGVESAPGAPQADVVGAIMPQFYIPATASLQERRHGH
jgi:hypothetical protein